MPEGEINANKKVFLSWHKKGQKSKRQRTVKRRGHVGYLPLFGYALTQCCMYNKNVGLVSTKYMENFKADCGLERGAGCGAEK